MTDSTLTLAARLAANLFVDAIKLAKPGARLAAKMGDRLLGGSPFNEREAQRFLTGGSEGPTWLDDHYPPEMAKTQRFTTGDTAQFHADGGPAEWLDSPRDVTCVVGGSATDNQVISNGPEYRIGAFGDPNADVHLCKTWDGQCHCDEIVSVKLSGGQIYTDYVTSTGTAADIARAQQSVHQTMAAAYQALDEIVHFPKTPDSQGEQPVGAGVSGPGSDGSEAAVRRRCTGCRHSITMHVSDDGPCTASAGEIMCGCQTFTETSICPACFRPGGNCGCVDRLCGNCFPPAEFGSRSTSVLIAALVAQVRIFRTVVIGDESHFRYIDELIADAESRSDQHAQAGD